jgi:hypothetical protein
MCLIWTQKYHLCGCIWNTQDLYCNPETESCWGARILIINCHLQTCKECWRSGDKRINPELANLLAQQDIERHRIQQDLEDQNAFQYEDDQIEYANTEEEEFEVLHPSRPTTPELDLNPEQMPRWLFGTEVMGDASRACEPVKLEKIWRDYRARRGKTDWYMTEGESSSEFIRSICRFWGLNECDVLTVRVY